MTKNWLLPLIAVSTLGACSDATLKRVPAQVAEEAVVGNADSGKVVADNRYEDSVDCRVEFENDKGRIGLNKSCRLFNGGGSKYDKCLIPITRPDRRGIEVILFNVPSTVSPNKVNQIKVTHLLYTPKNQEDPFSITDSRAQALRIESNSDGVFYRQLSRIWMNARLNKDSRILAGCVSTLPPR